MVQSHSTDAGLQRLGPVKPQPRRGNNGEAKGPLKQALSNSQDHVNRIQSGSLPNGAGAGSQPAELASAHAAPRPALSPVGAPALVCVDISSMDLKWERVEQAGLATAPPDKGISPCSVSYALQMQEVRSSPASWKTMHAFVSPLQSAQGCLAPLWLLPCPALASIWQLCCLQVDLETRDSELAALCRTARWQTIYQGKDNSAQVGWHIFSEGLFFGYGRLLLMTR